LTQHQEQQPGSQIPIQPITLGDRKFMELSRPVSKKSRRTEIQKNITAILYLLPAFFFIAVFMLYPLVYSGYISFFDWDGVSTKVFNNFANYRKIISDVYFWRALFNNATISVSALFFQVFFALLVAYFLVRAIGYVKRLYMFFYLVPVVISEICIGLLWGFIYNPYFGLLNNGLRSIGLDSLASGWLGNTSTAFPSVINAMNWTYLGLYILLFVAAIQDIPQDIFDSAAMDGAGHFHTFFSLVVPMIGDTIISTSLLCVISAFKTFSLVFVLTNGGPNHASEVLSTYLYKMGFNSFQMGYAATIGFVQMVLTALTGIILLRLMRQSELTNAYDS
jgi:raffinose/stachyose/melibiose transport system permease protein